MESILLNEQTFGYVDKSTKIDGLYERYRLRKTKADFILTVDEVLDSCWSKDDYSELFRILSVTITSKARKLARKWRSKRIEYEEFISLFYEIAWTVAEDYYYGGWKTDFYYYETLLLVMDRRAIDFIRTATGRQQTLDRTALLIDDFDEMTSNDWRHATQAEVDAPTDHVRDRMVVDGVLSDTRLDETERQYIKLVRCDPYMTQSEAAMALGYDHNEHVRRLQKRLATKLIAWGRYLDE